MSLNRFLSVGLVLTAVIPQFVFAADVAQAEKLKAYEHELQKMGTVSLNIESGKKNAQMIVACSADAVIVLGSALLEGIPYLSLIPVAAKSAANSSFAHMPTNNIVKVLDGSATNLDTYDEAEASAKALINRFISGSLVPNLANAVIDTATQPIQLAKSLLDVENTLSYEDTLRGLRMSYPVTRLEIIDSFEKESSICRERMSQYFLTIQEGLSRRSNKTDEEKIVGANVKELIQVTDSDAGVQGTEVRATEAK